MLDEHQDSKYLNQSEELRKVSHSPREKVELRNFEVVMVSQPKFLNRVSSAAVSLIGDSSLTKKITLSYWHIIQNFVIL